MKEYTFSFTLSEHKETLPFYSPNDMDEIELWVTYSQWTEGGKRQVMVNKVELDEVDIWPVLMAFKAGGFVDRLAEENYEFRLQLQIARNYPSIHQDAMARAEERAEWQRIK